MILRRHEDRDAAAGAHTYQMHQKMLSIGDDYWIENGAGQQAFFVDGKALHVRKTLILKDAAGRDLYKIQHKMMHVRDTMEIETDSGTVASVHKKLISPLREHWEIELTSGSHWSAQGKITDHEYHIEGPTGRIAEISKKWFRVRDTYGVSIAPGEDDAFVLAVTVVIDAMAHPMR